MDYKWYLLLLNFAVTIFSYALQKLFDAINNTPIISSLIHDNFFFVMLNVSKTISVLTIFTGIGCLFISGVSYFINTCVRENDILFGIAAIILGLICLHWLFSMTIIG